MLWSPVEPQGALLDHNWLNAADLGGRYTDSVRDVAQCTGMDVYTHDFN